MSLNYDGAAYYLQHAPSSPLDLLSPRWKGSARKESPAPHPQTVRATAKTLPSEQPTACSKTIAGGKHVYSSPEPRESEISSSHSSFTPEHGTYWEAADQDESEDAENKSSSSCVLVLVLVFCIDQYLPSR